MNAPFNATDGWAFGILGAAFVMPWAFRRWDRRQERRATEHQLRVQGRGHVRVLRRPYDYEREGGA